MNNKDNQHCILFLLLLTIISSFIPVSAVMADDTKEIRWYGIYDDYSQVSLDEIKQYFDQIIQVGSTDLHQEDIIERFGEPSDTYATGASDYLLYYSMNDQESAILFFQFFSEKKADEIRQDKATNTEDDTPLIDLGLTSSEAYLVEANILVLNRNHYEPIKMTLEEVEAWQNTKEDDQKLTTMNELVEKIGDPSEKDYNFKQEVWMYTWYRNSEKVDGLTYLMVIADSDNIIQSIQSQEKPEDQQ